MKRPCREIEMREAIWLVGWCCGVWWADGQGSRRGVSCPRDPSQITRFLPWGARDSPFNKNQWELLCERKGWMGGGARDLFLCCRPCVSQSSCSLSHTHTHKQGATRARALTRARTDNRKALQLNNRPPVKQFFNLARAPSRARTHTHTCLGFRWAQFLLSAVSLRHN